MTFRALQAGSSARISVNSQDTAVTTASQLQLQATARAVKPQIQPRFSATKAACGDAKPGRATCRSLIASQENGDTIAPAAASKSGYGPTEWHNAYQVPCTPGGQVQAICAQPDTYGPATVAIVDAYGYSGGLQQLEADMAAYNQFYGLPACSSDNGCLKVTNQRGGSDLPADDGAGLKGWSGETALDVESAHAVCQTCQILLVQADDNSNENLATAQNYAASQRPLAISDSWGGGTSDEADFVHPGIAQFVASGDNGVVPGANNPADFDTLTSVGGTVLEVNDDGSWASESEWSGSGGGCSPTIGAPAYQIQLQNWAKAGCGTQRGMNDISAAGGSMAAIYVQDSWLGIYGTSLATPLVAAMYTLANAPLSQAAAIGNGNPVSAGLNTALIPYANAAATNWHDITTGNNCSARYGEYCTTGPGYDLPSGFGTPKGLGGLRASSVADNQAPSTPGEPSLVLATRDAVTLQWSESTDNFGVRGYLVYRDGERIGLASGSNYTDKTVEPRASYEYTFRALDAAGNLSDLSSPVTAASNGIPGDLDGDGLVNIFDLNTMVFYWGNGNPTIGQGDVNGDGVVNIVDLNLLLNNWSDGQVKAVVKRP